MSPTKNSLTTLLHDLIKVQKNGLEIINKLSDVVSSKSDTVEIDILDENNVIKKVVIPSYGKLQSQIERLETNVKGLSGLGDADAVLQLADGSFRKVLKDSLAKEAKNITSITAPGGFSSRANWFFESFLNPLLYVSFNFGSQIKSNTERIEVARYILTLDTDSKSRYFNENFNGKSNLNYDEFLDTLLEQNILFYLDQDVITLPPRDLKFNGNFSVLKVLDIPITTTINGEEITKRDLKFKLDKLTYSDRDSRYTDTQQLKIGDSLIVNTNTRNTRYQITQIDEGTTTITVKLLEGFDKVNIGTDNLTFFGDSAAASLVDVNVGFNEKTVLFVKPIDPDSEIKATEWSPGVGYFSSDLTISDIENGERTLEQYYKDEVVDFGAYLFSMAKEGTPPSILAETPYTPSPLTDSFSMVQINKHVTDTPVIDEIKRLHAESVKLKNKIGQFDIAVSQKQSQLANKKYKSKVVRDTDRNELNLLVEERASASKLYSSVVRDINTNSIESGISDVSPKFKLRGFWPIPQAKFSSQTNPQEIIQFAISYRYVTKDGSANQAEQLEFVDTDGTTRRGSFTTWVEQKTAVRQRITDEVTGQVKWVVEDIESADTVNINQLDIPIRSGEGVEFRIKSLSEAGYPSNPAESEWSDIIRVDFPAELESTISVGEILDEAKKESVRISLQDELENKGIYRHVQESVESGGRYFAHSALELASGFVDDQQTSVSLFEKLKTIDDQLQLLTDLIEKTKGEVQVRVVDENGNEYQVEQNGKLEITAPNYRSEVESLSVKKGVIITKTYYMVVENTRASQLELYSKIYGPINRRPNASWDTQTSAFIADEGQYKFNGANTEYNSNDRYDQVPMMADRDEIINAFSDKTNPFVTAFNPIPYQSTQSLGQFINFRYSSIDGTESLFGNIHSTGIPNTIGTNGLNSTNPSTTVDDLEHKHQSNPIPSPFTSVASPLSPDFVVLNVGPLGGGFANQDVLEVIEYLPASSTQFVYDDAILVHRSHPMIPIWAEDPANPGEFLGTELIANFENNIRNSKFAILENANQNGNKQLPYYYDDTLNRSAKIGFEANDQFLLGGLSCGSYFFPKMTDHNQIRVEGNTLNAITNIGSGSNSAVAIPLVFQYRMTDFFGAGTNGEGLIGGKFSSKVSQLIYNKTIGIDIFHSVDEKFSFDVTVTAKYRSDRIDVSDTPSRSFQNTIDDLNDSLTTTLSSQPNISK